MNLNRRTTAWSGLPLGLNYETRIAFGPIQSFSKLELTFWPVSYPKFSFLWNYSGVWQLQVCLSFFGWQQARIYNVADRPLHTSPGQYRASKFHLSFVRDLQKLSFQSDQLPIIWPDCLTSDARPYWAFVRIIIIFERADLCHYPSSEL